VYFGNAATGPSLAEPYRTFAANIHFSDSLGIMEMNRLIYADDEGLRPQIRLLGIGAVISVILLGGSLSVMLGGFNDPGTPRFPVLSPGQPSIPGLPAGYPSVPAFPAGLPTDFPSGLIPTDLPTLPGGNP
jgi:hypothetical protein